MGKFHKSYDELNFLEVTRSIINKNGQQNKDILNKPLILTLYCAGFGLDASLSGRLTRILPSDLPISKKKLTCWSPTSS